MNTASSIPKLLNKLSDSKYLCTGVRLIAIVIIAILSILLKHKPVYIYIYIYIYIRDAAVRTGPTVPVRSVIFVCRSRPLSDFG